MICDRHPSALAKFIVWLPKGVLYFCGHCMQVHKPELQRRGYRMADLALKGDGLEGIK